MSVGPHDEAGMSTAGDDGLNEYVTATIGGQLFGLPIRQVQDVFLPERVTRVPLAPPEIAGVLNLRGRIVTLIDMRKRLGMPPRTDDAPSMALGVEARGEFYGLLIDASAKCSSSPTKRASPIRSISTRGLRACRPAFTGSKAN